MDADPKEGAEVLAEEQPEDSGDLVVAFTPGIRRVVQRQYLRVLRDWVTWLGVWILAGIIRAVIGIKPNSPSSSQRRSLPLDWIAVLIILGMIAITAWHIWKLLRVASALKASTYELTDGEITPDAQPADITRARRCTVSAGDRSLRVEVASDACPTEKQPVTLEWVPALSLCLRITNEWREVYRHRSLPADA